MSQKPVKYFALPQETLQAVLKHLAENPVAALYEKVSQALPVQENAPQEASNQAQQQAAAQNQGVATSAN
jgi:hypothetical protein